MAGERGILGNASMDRYMGGILFTLKMRDFRHSIATSSLLLTHWILENASIWGRVMIDGVRYLSSNSII